MPNNIAIVGSSLQLGLKLYRLFENDDLVDMIMFVGHKNPGLESKKLKFYQRELTRGYSALFEEHKIDKAIYLGIYDDSLTTPAQHQKSVENFFAASTIAKCQTVALISTTEVYGAHADRTDLNYEGSQAKPNSAIGKVAEQMEKLGYQYIHQFPNAHLQILRSALVVGYQFENFLTQALKRQICFIPNDSDVKFQFVHIDDLARAIQAMIEAEVVGVYNLAADQALDLEQVALLSERRLIRCPKSVLKGIRNLCSLLRLKNPPCFTNDVESYARWSLLVANVKFRQEVFFDFIYTGPEAYLESILPPKPIKETELNEFQAAANELAQTPIDAYVSTNGGLPQTTEVAAGYGDSKQQNEDEDEPVYDAEIDDSDDPESEQTDSDNSTPSEKSDDNPWIKQTTKADNSRTLTESPDNIVTTSSAKAKADNLDDNDVAAELEHSLTCQEQIAAAKTESSLSTTEVELDPVHLKSPTNNSSAGDTHTAETIEDEKPDGPIDNDELTKLSKLSPEPGPVIVGELEGDVSE